MKKLLNDFCNLYRAFSYLGKERKRYILGVIIGSSEMVILFLSPYINQTLIDIITGDSDLNLVNMLILLFAIFIAMTPLVAYGRYLQSIAASKSTANLRINVFSRITQISYEDVLSKKSGDWITLISDDCYKITGFFSSFAINNLIRFIVVFTGTFLLLLWKDWHIAIISIIYGGINLGLSCYLNPKTKFLEKEAKQKIVNMASFLHEILRGMPIIKVFGLKDMLMTRYLDLCNDIRKKRIDFRTMNGVTYGVVDFFAQSAQIVGFIFGLILFSKDRELSETVFCATLMGMMGDAVYRLSTFLLLFQPRIVSIERVRNIMDLPFEESIEVAYRKPFQDNSMSMAVCLENVSYIIGEQQILRNVSLQINKGEHIAIIGRSGSGKSTIGKLILGLINPQEGNISYFGVDSKKISKADVHSLFSYVPQENFLFEGSIEENIRLGKVESPIEDIQAAAKAADIHAFICNLPEGYATQIGEGGTGLSGGQKQRIAIARAILKDAPIVLLDEATASLDASMEYNLLNYFERRNTDITLITITHSLNSIRNADRIYVIDNGEIVESGTLSELNKNGRTINNASVSQTVSSE